jgi:hypothetical protein
MPIFPFHLQNVNGTGSSSIDARTASLLAESSFEMSNLLSSKVCIPLLAAYHFMVASKLALLQKASISNDLDLRSKNSVNL